MSLSLCHLLMLVNTSANWYPYYPTLTNEEFPPARGMTMDARFAVIIPTYCRPVHLNRCLGALARQSRTGLEVIIVNDGPEPPEIELEGGELQVRVIHTAGIGPTAARNRGLAEVHGDVAYVGFLDDDSVPAVDWAESCARLFGEFPEVTAQLGRIGIWTADPPRAKRRLWPGLRQKIYDSRDRTFKSLEFRAELAADYPQRIPDGLPGIATHLSCNNAAIRNSFLRAHGTFDERFRTMSDREMALRLLAHGQLIAYNPGMFVEHDHDPSLVRALTRCFRAAPYQRLLEREYPRLEFGDAAHQRAVPLAVPLTPAERTYLFFHGIVRRLAFWIHRHPHRDPLAKAPRK
jgi:GT2 family glycosyltransferase